MDAKTALNQLTNSNNGINRLVVMIGATSFVASETSVSFKFKMNPSLKLCQLELTPLDLYTMRFFNSRGRLVKEVEGLFADMLKETFEQETKLYLSL